MLKKCVFVIGSALGPYVEQLTDWITTAAVKVRQWINDHRGLVLVLFKVAGAIVLAGAGFSLLGRILGGIAGRGSGWLLGGVRLLGSARLRGRIGHGRGLDWRDRGRLGLGALFAALATPVGLVCVAVLALGGYVLYATGIAGDALRWLKGVFRDLAKDAMETFGAIGDALAAGDISLAAKVLWAVLKLEWQKGVNALTEIWVGVKETFMSVWTDFVYWMTGIATKAWAGLQSSWNLVTTGLTAGWTIFCDFVRSGWGATQNWLSKRWTDFMTFLGQYDADTGEQIKKNLDEDYAAEKGRRERETQSEAGRPRQGLRGPGAGDRPGSGRRARRPGPGEAGRDRPPTCRLCEAIAGEPGGGGRGEKGIRRRPQGGRRQTGREGAGRPRGGLRRQEGLFGDGGDSRGQDQRRRHLQRHEPLRPGLRRRHLCGDEEPVVPDRRHRRKAFCKRSSKARAWE